MIPSSFPSKEEIARLTAGMLLEIGAVHFNSREPFTHASGKKAYQGLYRGGDWSLVL